MPDAITIGSLFSGIGGLELGLEMAGLGPVIWQVEQDEFCRRKLAWRYPDAKRFEDVRAVGAADLAAVDLICGGFPCQDISSAGKRVGLAGARSGLWYEFARVVDEMRPRWVVVENVASGASNWVDPVRGALERLGYATLPIPLAASDCGAPHERARVFVVGASADADGAELREQQRRIGCPSRPADPPLAPQFAANAHYHSSEVHAQPRTHLPHAQQHGGWASEPAMVRVVHGFPGRVDYERALGNAVVPQCAEVIGHVIRRLANG